MSNTVYTVRQGDTFSSISRSLSGSEKYASQLRDSNPHASAPLKVGLVLTVPDFRNASNNKGFKKNGLDVKIDGTSFAVYDNFVLSSVIDGFRATEFNVPNEMETRSVIPPMTPLSVDVGYNGQSVFSGYLETPQPEASESKKNLKMSALSWPNLLTSNVPITAFPLEFKNSNLEVIADKIISPYNLEYDFFVDAGANFSKVSIEQSDTGLDFLAKLTKQRAYVIRDDEYGRVIFDNAEAFGSPVIVADGETMPDIDISVEYSTSDWYSHVTGILKGKHKRLSKKKTIENKFYKGILRPYNFEVSESDDGELETVVNSVAARMFASVFKVQLTVPEWEDKNGNLYQCGGIMKIRSPKDYINDYVELLISAVSLSSNGNSKVSTLTGIIKGVYSGSVPEGVPWT